MARPSSPHSLVLAHATAIAAALTGPLAASLAAQHEQGAADPNAPMYVAPRSAAAQDAIAGFQLAETLVCDLVASEPDLANPVAFAIDGKGRVYVAETFRIKDGVFDDRDYMQWKDDDLACRTVVERLAKYEKYIKDRIPRFSAYSERVRLLVDTDRNGTLDQATVFAAGFDQLADGIASGVLPFG
jgi:quinoprotein glucose dehydrogenase